jgi:hypothetical protein
MVKMKDKEPISLFNRMGSPTWSFKESWASNLTLASGTLTTVLTFTALPEQTEHFSKIGYATLSFLCAALIGLAPIMYNFIRKPVDSVDATGQPVVQYQGYVGLFLLACLVTIWGVMGQLITLWFSLNEIWKAGLMLRPVIRLFQGLLIIAASMIVVYAAFSIYWTIEKQKVEKEVIRNQALGSLRMKSSTTVVEAKVTPVLPDWALL